MCTSCRSPTEAGTVRRRTFSTALAYQFSSHPRISLNCLHLPPHLPSSHPFYWKARHYHVKRRDYLSLITWTRHYHWSIKSRHFLWLQLLQVSTAFEQTECQNCKFHTVWLQYFIWSYWHRSSCSCVVQTGRFFFFFFLFRISHCNDKKFGKLWNFVLSLVYIRGKKKATKWKKTLPNFQNHRFIKMKP